MTIVVRVVIRLTPTRSRLVSHVNDPTNKNKITLADKVFLP